MIDDILGKAEDFKYNFFSRFDVENKCDKCDMCITEKVSYEYEEYEWYCLNGKDIYEIGYCYIPLWYSKIKAKSRKDKILKQQQQDIAESYADMADWFKKYDEEAFR